VLGRTKMNSATRIANFVIIGTLLLSLLTPAVSRAADTQLKPFNQLDDTYSTTNDIPVWDALSGTDGLGRRLADYRTAPLPRDNRSVGVFYFLWHGSNDMREYKNIYNNTEVLAANPLAYENPASGEWPDPGHFAYWAKPLYGYYRSDDAWVMRKHMQLLTNAGVDYVVLDTTNLEIYKPQAELLMRTIAELQRQGIKAPQITFMTHTNSRETMDDIYETFYAEGAPARYPSTWFQWKGKPLIIGENPSAKVNSFFTFRYAQWPNEAAQPNNGWDWISFEDPQRVNYNQAGEKEQTSVSVAQNSGASAVFSYTAFYQSDNPPSRSRNYHNGKEDETPGALNYGHNFQEQWNHAVAEDPQTLLVLEWNEWIAGNWAGKASDPLTFYDAVNERWSRGIEPMEGGFGDNYYMQMVDNIRKYKGVSAPPAPGPEITIDINGGFSQWNAIRTAYKDFTGDTQAREHAGTDNLLYENRTGRNDIGVSKVARDSEHLYFYVRTVDDLTDHADPNWMTLYLNVDGNGTNGWHGYDYVLNRTAVGSTMTLERSKGEWNWETVSDQIPYRMAGNQLMVGIPRELLAGLGRDELQLEFKWVDNWQNEDNIMDFYQYGNAAPQGRLNYTFHTGALPERSAVSAPPSVPAAPAVTDGWYRIEDNDYRTEYKAFSLPASSKWISVNDPDSSGGTYSYLYNPAAKDDRHYRNFVRAGFEGNSIRWLTTKAPNGTEAEVFIDGLSQGKVNLYSTTVEKQAVAFEKYGLSQGQHEIMVVWLPQSGTYVHDAFEYGVGVKQASAPRPGENLALSAHVTQSSFGRAKWFGVSGARAVDGDPSTYWQADEEGEQWLILNFGREVTFDTVDLLPKTDHATITEYEILYGDGKVWKRAKAGGVLSGYKRESFEAVTADHLKLRILSTGGGPAALYTLNVFDSSNPGSGSHSPATHWEFTGDKEGWSGGSGVTDLQWAAGGAINGKITADNAQFLSPDDLGIDLSLLKVIRLGLTNQTSSDEGIVYFMTDEEPEISESKSIRFEMKDNSAAQSEYTIDLSEVPAWKGTLKQLIVSPGLTGGSGSMQLDYVRMLQDTAVAAWKFQQNAEGWTAEAGLQDWAWTSDKRVEGNVTGQSIRINSPDQIGADLANSTSVMLRLKNGTAATAAKLYFTTVDSPAFSEAKSVSFTLQPNASSYTNYAVNMIEAPAWRGVLKQLRIVVNPTANTGKFGLDEVRIEPYVLKTRNSKANWEFLADTEGWVNGGGIADFGWEQPGYAGGRITGNDPQIYSPDGLWLDLKNRPFVTFGLRIQSTSQRGTLYFSTLDSPNFSQGNSREFDLVKNESGFIEYTLNMSEVQGWNGVLKRLRFDPSEGANSGSFALDYIRVQPYRIKPVTVRTAAGTAPVMPTKVTTISAKGTESQADVRWDTIIPSQYAVDGSFTVKGEVNGGEAYVSAVVKVDLKPTAWEFTDSLEGWGNEFGISDF